MEKSKKLLKKGAKRIKSPGFHRKRVDFFLQMRYNVRVMQAYRHEKVFETNFSDVDFKDELKISSLLSRFEIVASESADELGFGYSYLKERGYAFFLAEIRCALKRAIPLDEALRVVTWPNPPSYVVFGREFEGYAVSGERILAATSRWCAIDFSTGKLLSPKAFPEQDYANGNIYDPTRADSSLAGKTPRFSMEEGEEKFSLKIANSEYDHNMHVNNTHYADYCLNCFSVAELKKKRVSFFAVSYVKQCKEGDFLKFFRKDDGENSLVCGFNGAGENVVRAEFRFEERK